MRDYDVVLSDGEHIGIPLALALARLHIEVPHVVIGHHLDTPSQEAACSVRAPGASGSTGSWYILGTSCPSCIARSTCPLRSCVLVPYGVDTDVLDISDADQEPNLVVSAGREHRDYGTLLGALPATRRGSSLPTAARSRRTRAGATRRNGRSRRTSRVRAGRAAAISMTVPRSSSYP